MQPYKRSRKKLLFLVLPLLTLLLGGGAYAAINLTAQKPAQHQALKPGINLDQGQKGLVGWWKLNGSTKDSTPYSDNGTNHGATPTTDRMGTANGAYYFAGIGHSIRLPQGANFNVGVGQALTTSLWMKAGTQGALADMFWHQDGCIGWDIALTTTGSIQYTNTTGDTGCTNYHTYRVVAADKNYADNNWHLVTGVIDRSAGTISLYVDGSLKQTHAIDNIYGSSNTGNDFYLGTSYGNQNPFTGSLSDARIYDRALSAGDIQNLYNSYNSQVNLYSPPGSGNGVNLTAGLVAYYPFNGNTKDATPFSNNLVDHGATLTSDRFGNPNSAYSFNGVSDYMQAPHKPAFDIGQPGLTLSAWIKPTQLSGTNVYAVINRNSPFLLWIAPSVAAVQTGLYQNSTWYSANSRTNSITVGVWQNVVLTYDGTYRRMYVNGVQSGPDITTISGNVDINSTSSLAIGYDYAAGGRYYFPGDIDDVRIYNRALSAAEVQALYNLPD